MGQTSQNWMSGALRTVLLLLVVAVLGVLLYFSLSPTRAAVDRRATIDVRGEASVETKPDRAVATFEVQTDGSTAAEAAQENAKRSATLIAALRAAMHGNDSLETTSYNVYERYETIAGGERKQVGYRASQRIMLTFNDAQTEANGTKTINDRVAPGIALGLRSGATGVSGPTFSVSENNTARHRARAEAVHVAERRANQLAKESGVKIRALHYLKENDYTPHVVSTRSMATENSSANAIVPPETETVRHSVEASYYVS